MRIILICATACCTIACAQEVPTYWQDRDPGYKRYFVVPLYATKVYYNGVLNEPPATVGIIVKVHDPTETFVAPFLMTFHRQAMYSVGDTIVFIPVNMAFRDSCWVVPEDRIEWIEN